MALFCNELLKAAAGPPKNYPRPSLMTPEEQEKARREWWKTEVDSLLEDLTLSIRIHRIFVALLLVIILLTKWG